MLYLIEIENCYQGGGGNQMLEMTCYVFILTCYYYSFMHGFGEVCQKSFAERGESNTPSLSIRHCALLLQTDPQPGADRGPVADGHARRGGGYVWP